MAWFITERDLNNASDYKKIETKNIKDNLHTMSSSSLAKVMSCEKTSSNWKAPGYTYDSHWN